jgi:hypothetical protein
MDEDIQLMKVENFENRQEVTKKFMECRTEAERKLNQVIGQTKLVKDEITKIRLLISESKQEQEQEKKDLQNIMERNLKDEGLFALRDEKDDKEQYIESMPSEEEFQIMQL